jgi:glucose-6-phosphate-specific signal transduction histidine kinase
MQTMRDDTRATRRGRWGQAGRDLLGVAVLTLAAFVLSATLEVREWMTEATRPLEHYQMDELPLTFAVLALALAWFSFRRWREAERELRLRVQAQAQLAEREDAHRLLAQKYMLVQEEERRNLARELHDEMGQCLNAIKLDAVSIRNVAKGRDADVEAGANAIIELSGHVYDVVRGMTQRLRPAALDALGLRDALADLVAQWSRRNSAVRVRFEATGDLEGLGEAVNITVYRLVQECLTNIVKHARASSVTVSVERAGAALHVTVADDGRGMDLNARHGGLGLLGLRERVEALSGQLELHSASGDGLRVHAWLPISAGPDAASIASLRGDAHETQGTAP